MTSTYWKDVMSIHEFYERRIFPRILDLAMLPLARYRRSALRGASGNVLEIGFGTGLNLPFYPPEVTSLTAVDPMTATPRPMRKRLEAARFPIDRYTLAVDAGLPFEAGTFDCATVTWTLCTVPDAVAGLKEVLRVVRPEAPLLFVEHGLSDNAQTARWQNRLDGIWGSLACGCHLNRPMDRIIESSGFRIKALERFDAPGLPRTHGHLYVGVALAPG